MICICLKRGTTLIGLRKEQLSLVKDKIKVLSTNEGVCSIKKNANPL